MHKCGTCTACLFCNPALICSGHKMASNACCIFVTYAHAAVHAGRWGCKLSQKLFVGREYVLKHVRNKHAAVVEAKQEEVVFCSCCKHGTQRVACLCCCPGSLCTGLALCYASSFMRMGHHALNGPKVLGQGCADVDVCFNIHG